MAHITGKPIDQIGTTIFRPPYSPVSIGAFAVDLEKRTLDQLGSHHLTSGQKRIELFL